MAYEILIEVSGVLRSMRLFFELVELVDSKVYRRTCRSMAEMMVTWWRRWISQPALSPLEISSHNRRNGYSPSDHLRSILI